MANEPKRTVPLNQPLTRFRNPLTRAQPTTSLIMSVQLNLSNGQIIVVPSDVPIMLGRGTTSANGGRKIDLESVPGAAEGISRDHALLTLTDGILYVKDFNSTNGTFLNKMELYPMRNYIVQDDNILSLGKVKIKVKFVVSESHG